MNNTGLVHNGRNKHFCKMNEGTRLCKKAWGPAADLPSQRVAFPIGDSQCRFHWIELLELEFL
jgi:hypothetical protein